MLLQAIDNYDVYNTSTRDVLKAIIASYSQEDGYTKISINHLSDLSKVSKQGVYNALKYIERDKVVERYKKSGDRATYFKVDQDKISKIYQYYNKLISSKKAILESTKS